MGTNIVPGICAGCHREFPKNRMTKHIADCAQAKAGNHAWFHLLVQGLYDPGYWLHVRAQPTARLRQLDDFLRWIWLECRGHMSEFAIGGERYLPQRTGYLEGRSMEVELREVLQPGNKFTYTYDFGTPTELALRVLAERQGAPVKGRVTLLARNMPYEFPCDVCGSPATQLCSSCSCEGRGWVCESCASKHECGEEMLLPIVNPCADGRMRLYRVKKSEPQTERESSSMPNPNQGHETRGLMSVVQQPLDQFRFKLAARQSGGPCDGPRRLLAVQTLQPVLVMEDFGGWPP